MAGAANYDCSDPSPPTRIAPDAGRDGGAVRNEYHPMDFRPIPLADEASDEWRGWLRTTKPEGAGEPMDLPTAGTRGLDDSR